MNDSSNFVLTAANHNFSAVSAQQDDGDAMRLIFLGLQQVANAIAGQVSDSGAQSLAQAASGNFSLASGAIASRDAVNFMALGLSQLATTMQFLN
jgi:hypothetical protein